MSGEDVEAASEARQLAYEREFEFEDEPDPVLSQIEKTFLLTAEKGDVAGTKRIIDENKNNPKEFSINCVDPLHRSALLSAIENENFELIEMLLEEGIQVNVNDEHSLWC
jgi:transient receptor potential cation channel subfamily C member 4